MRRPTTVAGLLALVLRRRAAAWRLRAGLAAGLCLGGVMVGRTQGAERPARAAHRARDARLAWTGDGFGVVWSEAEDDRPHARAHVHFAALDPRGRRRGAPTRVSLPERSLGDPQLVWTGRAHGLAFGAHRPSRRDPRYEVHFARLSAQGALVGAPQLLSDPANMCLEPRLAFEAGAHRVAWRQAAREEGAALGRLAEDGAWTVPPRLAHAGGVHSLRLEARGAGDVLAWREPRSSDAPEVVRVRWVEGSAGDEVRLVAGRGGLGAPVLAPREGEVALAWIRHDPSGGMRLEFAAVTPRGVRVPVREVTRGGFMDGLALAKGAPTLLLAWGAVVERESIIQAAEVSPEGALVRGPWRLDDGTRFAASPSLAWDGRGYGAVWIDGRDGGARVYFARLDRDGAREGPAVPVSD